MIDPREKERLFEKAIAKNNHWLGVIARNNALIPVENAHIIKDRIPQAELFIIPGAGHMFQFIDPVGIHQRIVEFLK